MSGCYYFLYVVDDFTRAIWVYLLKDKSEACDKLINFCTMVKPQFDVTIQRIRSDNGYKFIKGPLEAYLVMQGILHETSYVDMPQQNGRVERKNQHILNVARASRFQASLPLKFWGEYVLTTAYLINLAPTKLLNCRTSFKALFGVPSSFEHLKVFGCLAYAHHHHRPQNKFEERAYKCIFLGYPHGKKGWLLYDLHNQKLIGTRDIQFYEHVFPYADRMSPLSCLPVQSKNLQAQDLLQMQEGHSAQQDECLHVLDPIAREMGWKGKLDTRSLHKK